MATSRLESDVGQKSHCDNCREVGLLQNGHSFCRTCNLMFCVPCEKVHGRFAADHETEYCQGESVAGKQSLSVSCLVHYKEASKLYCQNHELLICPICKENDHNDCTVKPIAEACKEFGQTMSKDICDTIEKLALLHATAGKYKRDKKLKLETVISHIRERKHLIHNLKQKFINMFDKYEAQMDSHEDTYKAEMSSSIRLCDSLFNETKELLTGLDNVNPIICKEVSFQQLIFSKHGYKNLKSLLEEIRGRTITCNIALKEDRNFPALQNQLSNLVHKDIVDSDELVDSVSVKQPKKKSYLAITSCTVIKESDARVRSDTQVPILSGCCWLPDDSGVILCDYQSANKNLKILDKEMNITFTALCSSDPFDVACIDENSVVVTLPCSKELHFIAVKPGFKFKEKKDLKLACYGVDVHDKNIFVSVSDTTSKGLKILSCHGDDVTFIPHVGPGTPRYLCLNPDGTRVYYTGGSGNDLFIKCITKDGHGIFSVSSTAMKYPRGIISDEDGNIMVYDDDYKRVEIVRADGVFVKAFLSEKDNILPPLSMCINKTYDVLVIASLSSSSPRVSKVTFYKLEYA